MPRTKERCNELREETRRTIIKKSMMYFARNGFAGTKISELAKHIGIAQGTMYIYFESKEDLYNQIVKEADTSSEVKQLKLLSKAPLSARKKLKLVSEHVLQKLETDEMFAAVVAINAQLILENADNAYKTELYEYTAQIIAKGQKEGNMIEGSIMKLSDYYWGVIYLYAIKRLYTKDYEMITTDDLLRTIMKSNRRTEDE